MTIEEAERNYRDLVNQKYKIEKQYDEEIKKAEEELNKAIVESLPKPIWGYSLKFRVAEKSSWAYDVEAGTEIVNAVRIIINLGEIEPLYAKAKQRVPGRDDHFRGISYFRMNKVLLTTGGGTYVFKSPQIVEDDEWEMMKKGEVPERLKKNYPK